LIFEKVFGQPGLSPTVSDPVFGADVKLAHRTPHTLKISGHQSYRERQLSWVYSLPALQRFHQDSAH
jgi:hypothetical protein